MRNLLRILLLTIVYHFLPSGIFAQKQNKPASQFLKRYTFRPQVGDPQDMINYFIKEKFDNNNFTYTGKDKTEIIPIENPFPKLKKHIDDFAYKISKAVFD